MPSETTPKQSHDKWIVITIWLGLLLATLYTSNYAATALNFGITSRAFVPMAQYGGIPTAHTPMIQRIAVFTGLILMLIVYSQLAWAWLKFFSLTRELIKQSSDEASKDDNKPDPGETRSTLVGDVVRPLGYAWLALFAIWIVALVANLNIV